MRKYTIGLRTIKTVLAESHGQLASNAFGEHSVVPVLAATIIMSMVAISVLPMFWYI